MIRTLYFIIIGLIGVLVYTIYAQDLKVTDVREYEKKVVIYTQMKCSYCTNAKELLDKKDIPYIEIDITWDKDMYNKLHQETGQSTLPYIFINQKFIGGFSDLSELESKKQLDSLLKH
jgi:glutaredoxin 3